MNRVRRAPFVDELVSDNQQIVLLDNSAVLLSELATSALSQLSTERSMSIAEFATLLKEEFGEPPHCTAIEAAQTLIRQLAAEGLVIRSTC